MGEHVRHSGRRALTGFVAVFVLSLGVLVLGGGRSALAASTFSLGSSFGAKGAEAGEFRDPGAVGVEAGTGDVFVVDTKNGRVQKFEPSGGGYVLVGTIAGPQGTVSSSAFMFKDDPGVAVDGSVGASRGDVYVVSGKATKEVVYQFRPEGGHPDTYVASGVRMEGFVEGGEKKPVRGLAVGSGGEVFVAYGKSVSVFSAAGVELASMKASSEVSGVAVSGSTVYVVSASGLERWEVSGKYELEHSTVIGKASSGSAYSALTVGNRGRVYVDVVYQYEATKSYVAVFAANAGEDSSPLEVFGTGSVQASYGLGYSALGDVPTVLVSDESDDEVHVFQYDYPEVDGCGVSAITTSSALVGGCTVASNALQAEWVLYYKPLSGGFLEVLGGTLSSEGVVGGALSGLEPAEEYTYELLAKSSHGEADMEGGFVTLPVAPLVLASGATEVLAYGASMNGTVDPQDSTVFTGRTFYRFQYGPCRGECAGSPYPYEAPEVSAGSGHQAVAVSEALKELEPEAAYHYRVVAIGPGGEALSGEQVFTTAAAPAGVQALTGPASSVTQSTATLNGTVDPGGQATTYAWEVGTSTSYGTTVYGSLLAESEPVAVSLALSELRAGTTYHYRLVSTSRSDTSYGADEMFTTSSYGGEPLVVPSTPSLLPAGLTQASSQGQAPAGGVLPSKVVKLTKAQLLAKALKACRKDKSKTKRLACEKLAHKKYPTKTIKKTTGKS